MAPDRPSAELLYATPTNIQTNDLQFTVLKNHLCTLLVPCTQAPGFKSLMLALEYKDPESMRQTKLGTKTKDATSQGDSEHTPPHTTQILRSAQKSNGPQPHRTTSY